MRTHVAVEFRSLIEGLDTDCPTGNALLSIRVT